MIFERGDFKSSKIQKSFIVNSLNESRQFDLETAYSSKRTVFLSHKHDDIEDEEELKGFIEILNDLNVKVYIDSMDNKMPAQTSGDTAKRIKKIIMYCDKFILLATEKAIVSNWCNWELGIGDASKYLKHIALVPIKDKGKYDFQYKGNEYLQIYPVIDYEDGTNYYNNNGGRIAAGYYYRQPPDEDGIRWITPLSDWLNDER
jgi:hypothetical protein